MEIKVSVILPVFNVDKYIKRCLDSLVNQTLKEIEIIIINDGSTDNTKRICEEYAKKYDNIKLINKKNEGVSKARNIALKKVRGEYLAFIDGDDWIDRNAYEIMYNTAKRDSADVVQCGVRHILDNGKIRVFNKNLFNTLYQDNEILRQFLLGKINAISCDKIYKVSIWKENDIYFPENLSLGEDQITTCQVVYNSKRFIALKDTFYNYYRRSDSCTTSKFSLKNMDMLISMKYIRELLKQWRVDFYIENEYMLRYIKTITIFIIDKYILDNAKKNDNFKKIFIDDFKLNTKNFYKKEFLSFKTKLEVFLIRNLFNLYVLWLKLKIQVKKVIY